MMARSYNYTRQAPPAVKLYLKTQLGKKEYERGWQCQSSADMKEVAVRVRHDVGAMKMVSVKAVTTVGFWKCALPVTVKVESLMKKFSAESFSSRAGKFPGMYRCRL
jgi:hypothetical protein